MDRARERHQAMRAARADPAVRASQRLHARRVRVLGLVVCAMGLVLAAEFAVFLMRAERVDATVTSTESRLSGTHRTGTGKSEYRPSFVYTDASGQTHEAVARGWRTSWGWPPGTLVPVFVTQGAPAQVRPDTGWGNWSRPAIVCAIGVVIVGATSLSLRTLTQHQRKDQIA